ncbi:hypothetical protein EG68_06248 [Paragonimus skrjabini miyazakii]|uniref:Uncharacterized protein n=1 Tax=Paragonimus skrjabini miyazakii TaxID=59628 RepID=A0A8S9Y8L1_9TREM|nr:hypothetical protein EG68_06248 [Paragonimus skrjabini miyazakii]
MESPIVSSYRLHTSKAADRHAVVSSIFSPGPQTTASGSAASTGSAGAMSMSSAGLTNTSLVSGSLFDPGASKQTLNSSSGVHSAEPVHSTPPAVHGRTLATEMSNSNATAPVVMLGNRQKTSEDDHTKKMASATVMSAPGYRRNRRAITTSGFPAFSWCTGLHKTTGCAALLGGSVQRGSTSHIASGRHSPREPHQKPARTRTSSGSRPVPPPSPGPVVVEVVLIRGTRSGLGFSIAGGVGNETVDGDSGIFVTKLTPGGVAETDGRMGIGDRIVQVNETSLVEVSHEQAVEALKHAGEQVRLILVKQSAGPPLPTLRARTAISEPETPQTTPMMGSLDVSTSPADSHMAVKPLPQNECTSKLATHRRHSAPFSPTPKIQEPEVGSSRDGQEEGEEEEEDQQHRTKEEINPSCFVFKGQELLEAQMAGIVDYAAAASVADLVTRWPKARLVTLYRSVKPAATSSTIRASRGKSRHRSYLVRGSLGLNIVGGDGSEATFVSQVHPDRPAGLSKRVFVGDRVLAVNGIDVAEHGHERAASALRNAPDRVDLVLVYCPKEYAEFEKCYSRQLKAVGHRLSNKAINQLRVTSNHDVRSQQPHSKRSADRPVHKHDRRRERSSSQSRKSSHTESGLSAPIDDKSSSRTELFLRCQVDYDPMKESQQSVPKKAFNLRSGDLICVTSWTDSEWWKAQRLDPTSNEPIGPIGLVPSRARLERRERTRTRHVNFLARVGRSSELICLSLPRIDGSDEEDEVCAAHRRDKSVASHASLASSARTQQSDRNGNEFSDKFVLSYTPVTPVQLSFARPVVILGHMKDRLADELLNEFPDRFGTAVPYTTRSCRPNEVEGRDYHFVISREIMVADIAAQRYLEAGEYNGNLYGTHLESVFEVAELGLHCLLDVGGPALRRLEAAGLPPIAILVLLESFSSPTHHPAHSDKSSETMNDAPPPTQVTDSVAFQNMQLKLARLIRHFSNYLTAIITTDDFFVAYERVKEIIFENSGPVVWLNAPQPVP